MSNRNASEQVQSTPGDATGKIAADGDYGRSDHPDWRSVHWPSLLRAMTIDTRRLHVMDTGAATRAYPATDASNAAPLLLIHGLGGRWQNWLENIPRLATARRVVAIDLPGFGRSQLPTEPISITGYVHTLERAFDLLELDRPVIVGNSMGGLVAIEFALRHSQLASGLVLVDAACLSVSGRNPFRARAALTAFGRVMSTLPNGVNSTLTRPRARHIAFAGIIRHPTQIATDMLYELSGPTQPAGTPGALAAMTRHDVHAELGQITLPTLVVHGREDILIPLADGEALAGAIPAAKMRVFDDAGHLPMVERPIAFNEALLTFLAAASNHPE
jgi:pimeloyl-ACP methyl ester carboxylesterase